MLGWILFSAVDPLIRCCESRRRVAVDELPSLIGSPRELNLDGWNVGKGTIKSGFRSGHYGNRRTGGVIREVLKTFGWKFIGLGCIQFVNSILNFLTPLLLRELVGWLGSETGDVGYHGFDIAVGVGLCCTAKAIVNSQHAMFKDSVGAELYQSLVKSVYEICLKARGATLGENTHTILTADVDKIVNVFLSVNDLWTIPLEIGAALYLLYTEVEFAFFAGLLVILFILPINRWIAMKIGSGSKSAMEAKDERVHFVEEILKGIRQIKMMGWENHFAARVTAARNKELEGIAHLKYLDAFCVYFWASTSVLFSVATFSLHILLGHTLRAETVFAANAVFDILIGPLNSFPLIINGIMEGMVSIRRMEGLIANVQRSNQNSPDKPTKCQYAYHQVKKHHSSDVPAIIAQGATFKYPQIPSSNLSHPGHHQSKEMVALKDLSFTVRQGSFTVICGEVGSGKSTLLNALCGEVDQVEGKFDTEGIHKIALVAQKPSLFCGTIRDNILFGEHFDVERYWGVLAACGLEPDLGNLKGGDLWQVGPQGSKLSGGQRARVALARALYAQHPDIYLLDDILSSVDAHVADWIIENALMGPILSNKTRVLVTKSSKCVDLADQIIRMKCGEIESIETREGRHAPVPTGMRLGVEAKEVLDSGSNDVEEDGATSGEAEVNAEDAPTGHVEFGVYLRYFTAIGWQRLVLVLVSMCLMQATRNGGDIWLAKWIDRGQDAMSRMYLWMFVCITACNSVFTLVRAFSFAGAGMAGACNMHANLMSHIMHARMKLFDSTSLGCMLNWFSSDTARIDDRLPFIANIFLANVFAFVGACAVLAIGHPVVLGLMVMAVVPWGSPFSGILVWQSKFRKTARELRRVEASTMSPLHTLFSESLDSIPTIRAFQVKEHFHTKLDFHLEQHTRAKMAGQMLNRWIGIRLQLSSAALVTGAALIAASERGNSEASIAGLGLTYVLPLVGLLSGLLTTACETEQEMVAVERILMCCQGDSESEPQPKDLPQKPLKTPPSIEFQGVTLRYAANLPAVLSSFTLEIMPGQKVALCGRTGAGKSTVVNALLRMADIESGSILVNGKDIKCTTPSDARSMFAVIPQVPFLFDGTLRENIDPLSVFTDSDIIGVLRDLELLHTLSPLSEASRPPDGGGKSKHQPTSPKDGEMDILNMRIVTGGAGLSHGERQMICLARAVLLKPKCVVLDEFACGIHSRTEAAMRKAMSRHFRDATVIEIAHDLRGILEYNKVVVLAKGTIVEAGDPKQLVELNGSVFRSMIVGMDGKREF